MVRLCIRNTVCRVSLSYSFLYSRDEAAAQRRDSQPQQESWAAICATAAVGRVDSVQGRTEAERLPVGGSFPDRLLSV